MAAQMDATWVKQGCTKVVFYFRDLMPDYVVKIPFMGFYCLPGDVYDEDEDINNIVMTADIIDADPFGENANAWDYCERESNLYEMAMKSHLEEFFAGTYFIGVYNGCPIYISEYVDKYGWPRVQQKKFQNEDDYEKIVSNLENGEEAFGKKITLYLIEKYGKEKIVNLLHFIDDYDICDLHSGNVFFTQNGNLKIVDYSGYNESY